MLKDILFLHQITLNAFFHLIGKRKKRNDRNLEEKQIAQKF